MKSLIDVLASEVLPEGGHFICGDHTPSAPSANNGGGRCQRDNLVNTASPEVDGEGGQKSGANHKSSAPSLLNIYVQQYEQAQKMRMETMNRIRCWLRDTVPKEQWPCNDAEKSFNDAYISSLPLGVIPNDLRCSVNIIDSFEKESAKFIKRELKNHPLWPYLEGIKGMGPVLAGRLLHRIGDIKRFDNVAKLWSYCGLDGPGWRQRPHSWALTSICFNIAESFQKQKMFSGGYRDIYDKRKEYESTRPPCEKCKEAGFEENCRLAHINNKARRYTVKEFLKDLWIEGHGRGDNQSSTALNS